MNGRGILFVALTALAYTMPVAARAFSALDVMTICLTTPEKPASLTERFIAKGWQRAEDSAKHRDDLAIALMAMEEAPFGHGAVSYNSSDWHERWSIYKKLAGLVLGTPEKDSTSKVKEKISALVDPESDSLLMIRTLDGQAKLVQCNLAVTGKATRSSTYQPRLTAPAPTYGFRGEAEYMHFNTTRSSASSTAASLDAAVIEREIGLKTDIVAAFEITFNYPAMAVSP